MRAFAGVYYENLRAMYDYLGVRYHAQRFLFCFSRISAEDPLIADEKIHFIHSSSNHRIPPIRPPGVPIFIYILEIVYLLLWYSYFSLCCYLVFPLPGTVHTAGESFGEYVRRIYIPDYFVSNYLLPLMSSVATCSHQELLAFPANDLIEYKRKTTGTQHYVVSEGVREVQRKLSKGLDLRLGERVVAVEPGAGGVRIRWQNARGTSDGVMLEDLFDRVVLAVSPAIVAAIFEPLRNDMLRIPTKEVTSVVHTEMSIHNSPGMEASTRVSKAEVIHFRTSGEPSPRTESRHIQASNILVTTCLAQPIDSSKIIQESTFTRVLRTPESRESCNKIFGPFLLQDERTLTEKRAKWKNGDGGVWLAGGWCWDGMVLLEGCVVSAMKIAHDFGVEVPWQGSGF